MKKLTSLLLSLVLMVSVLAAGPADVLFLNVGRVLKTCSETCAHHSKLIRNLLTVSAGKNLNLSRRIFHTSSKSIRRMESDRWQTA